MVNRINYMLELRRKIFLTIRIILMHLLKSMPQCKRYIYHRENQRIIRWCHEFWYVPRILDTYLWTRLNTWMLFCIVQVASILFSPEFFCYYSNLYTLQLMGIFQKPYLTFSLIVNQDMKIEILWNSRWQKKWYKWIKYNISKNIIKIYLWVY